MSIEGWQWALYYQKKKQAKHERSREFSEAKIEWQLPESMLPVRCVKSKQIKWSYLNQTPRWYINGSTIQQSFVYLLKGIKDNEVLYLSLIHISEPTRLGMISYAVFCLKKKK